MAKLEKTVNENFDQLVARIQNGILHSSISATLEESSDFTEGDARCSVRVFERYSTMGKNRVSLTVTFFQKDDSSVHVSGITAGGSQAVMLKVNTIGENAFLDRLRELLQGDTPTQTAFIPSML